jgi:hypothetical protein
MIVGPETWPVYCPACEGAMDLALSAKTFVVPGSCLKWSYDTCNTCDAPFRARRLSDGMIEFELVESEGEDNDEQLQEEDL